MEMFCLHLQAEMDSLFQRNSVEGCSDPRLQPGAAAALLCVERTVPSAEGLSAGDFGSAGPSEISVVSVVPSLCRSRDGLKQVERNSIFSVTPGVCVDVFVLSPHPS